MRTRIRLGIIIPSNNTVAEPDLYHMAPPHTSIHTSRVFISSKSDEQHLKNMLADLDQAAKLLDTANLHGIGYLCTTGSHLEGTRTSADIITRIKRQTNVKATTTSEAIVLALKALSVEKLAVATPYPEDLNKVERMFLEESGFHVTSIRGLGVIDIGAMQFEPRVAYDLAKKCFKGTRSEAVLISCTNLRAIEVIQDLERELNVPVVTANQASLWRLLKLAGVKANIDGFGKLLHI